MQQPQQSDSLDYNNTEFDVNDNVEHNYVFDDAFDDMPNLDIQEQGVGLEHQPMGELDYQHMSELDHQQIGELDHEQMGELDYQPAEMTFEGQEIPIIGASDDSDTRRGFGLRSKILLFMFLLVATSLGTSLFGTLRSVRASHFETLHANRLLAAESLEQNVEDFFAISVSQLLTLSSTQLIQDSVEQRNLSYVEKYGDDYNLFLEEINIREEQWSNAAEDASLVDSILTNDQKVNAASYQLRDFAASYGGHSGLVITDQYGATVSASHKLSDYYHGDKEWWQVAWANGQGEVYISKLSSNEDVLTQDFVIALPLISDAGNLIGVMRSTLSTTELNAFISEPRFGETGHAVLLDANGDVLFDPGLTLGHNSKGIPLDSRQKLVNSDRQSLDFTDEVGDRSLFVNLNVNANTVVKEDQVKMMNTDGSREYASILDAMDYLRTQSLSQAINDLGWTVVIRQKFNEASQAVNNVNKWNIIVFIFTLLATLFFGVIFARRLTKPLNHLVDVMRQVGAGDLSTLAKVNTKDEIGLLAGSVNDTVIKLRDVVRTERERDLAQEESEMLQSSISGFLDVITDVAQGDLTRRGTVSSDILGNVVDATNVMVEEVGFLLSNVKETATQVGSGAQNMIQSSESIAESNQSRVQTANQLAEAIHSVSQSMQQMAGQVDTAAATALQTYSASQEGSLVVKDTLVGMQNIRQEVQTISKRIKNLGDRSLEISEIVETIRHLASQTNLLALNAAIEAAGAGEAGGRFAIVADEVRKLAENSAQATERVSSLIQSVQEEVQDVVISVEDGIREVEGGYELATQAGQRLDDIGIQAQSSAGLAQKIAELVREQVQRVGIVNSNLQMMSKSGTQSQHVVAEGKQTAEQLQVLSQELLASLSHFRLEETQLEAQLVD